ncbi:TetR/AcrR family transcriptional regulator [Desulfosarcina sp. OttesenSCG-928-A07]|nr:TetR/AcrR family transcriptional regulator [Desulfosarcina sp. OttesenSCG-928-G17]MDL2329240.1 TetR/AcrR family transcriptional regulator [Desulfosarcina sp. OttesenSCG-928-A07]
MARKNTTRERLIQATIRLLQRKGYAGVGLSTILSEAGAPKGVLYHHFPEGKAELVAEAVRASIHQIVQELQGLRKRCRNPLDALEIWLGVACDRLEKSGYETGCPLAAAALEAGSGDVPLKRVLADGFATLRSELALFLASAGIPEPRSQALSLLLVSGYEGALMQARAASDKTLFEQIGCVLIEMVRHEHDKSEKEAGP